MPEPNSVDGGKTEIELINLDDDTDTGDSEFELPEGSGAQDDDSIAADEDVADEEEVNGLMRESEMSLSELLASYGLPASAIPDGPVGASVVGSVQSGNERPTLRKRRHTALGNTSSEAQVDGNRAGHQTTDAVTADKVIRSEAEVGGANTSAIEIDLTSSNGNADEEEDEEAEDDDRADDADNDEDEVGSDEADGGEDDDMKSHAVSLWCQALAAGDSPPAYNSEEDEDYLPNVEGEGDWRGEMHVGDDYQATVPPSTQPINSRQDSHLGQEALMLWQPGHLPEVDVERYQQTYSRTLSLAAPISRIPDDEEALFLLLRSNFDTDEALQRLQMKPVQPTEIPPHLETWSELDCAAFEKGFIAFNKNFLQIQENKLRHKTVAELVHFYYLWKKTARHDEFIRLYRREKKKPLHPGITDFMDCLMKEQLSSAVPPDSVQSDRTAGGPSDLEVGSQGTNQSAVSVPKAQVTSTTLDVAAPSTVPSSTSEPASISRRELGDDPDVLVSPHLRTITQSVGVPVSSSTSSGHVEA